MEFSAAPLKSEFCSIEIIDTRHQFLANGKVWFHAVNRFACPMIFGVMALERQGNFWWFNDLFVRKELRRTGIARGLVRRAIQYARETDALGCGAGIDFRNEESIALFSAEGFRYVYDYSESPTRLYTLTW